MRVITKAGCLRNNLKCQCGSKTISGWFTFMEGCQIAPALKHFTHKYCERCRLHLLYDRKGKLKRTIKFITKKNNRVEYRQEIIE